MTKSNTFFKYHLILLFLGILILPVVNQVAGVWTFERKDENRTFKDSLVIDIQQLDKFPKEAEAYFNDNFSFRSPFLDFYHHLKFRYLKVSPHPDKVLIGKDNWYFGAEDELDIYEGRADFTETQLADLLKEWKFRQKYFDEKNIKCYWVIAPFKHNIYEEFLPFNVSKSKNIKRTDQLKNYFAEALPNLIIDPTAALLANKKDTKLFSELDNHWSYSAGEIATELLLSKMKLDFPEEEFAANKEIIWKDSLVMGGIHKRVLGINKLSETDRFPVEASLNSIEIEKYGFPIIKNFPYKSKYELRYLNEKAKSKKTVLFIRDSFGTMLIPFAREAFQESVFIFDAWRYALNEPIIDEVKPDIVVFVCVERNVQKLLRYLPKYR